MPLHVAAPPYTLATFLWLHLYLKFWINLLPIRKGLSASQEILREPLLCQPSPYDHLALIKSSALLLCYKSITEIPWWCCLPAHYLHNLFICSYIVTLRSSSMIPLTYDHLSWNWVLIGFPNAAFYVCLNPACFQLPNSFFIVLCPHLIRILHKTFRWSASDCNISILSHGL